MAQLAELPKDLGQNVVDVLNCKDLDPTAVVFEPVPSPVVSRSSSENGSVVKKTKKNDENGDGEKEFVLGRNVHNSCLDITEPEANDDVTGDKEAYMAAVLARYRQTLLERTKHHLGNRHLLCFISHLF